MKAVSVKLTAVVIFIVPPTALGAVYYGRYVRKLSQRTQRAVASSISLAEEKLGAIKTIHAFNGVPLETRNYKDRIEKVFELYRKEAFATVGVALRKSPTSRSCLCFRASSLEVWA